MNFQRIEYFGGKPYRDQTPLRNLWMPGDIKLVTDADALRLLKFVEFRRHAGQHAAQVKSAGEGAAVNEPTTGEDADLALARTEQERLAQEQEQKRMAHENVLLELDTMDKAALEAYALEKFQVDVDKRLSLDKLRIKVRGLVEQFGG